MSDQTPEAPRIEFPCEDYPMKVIGEAHPDFQARVVAVLLKHVDAVDEDGFDLQKSRNGRFLSLRFRLRVESVEHIKALFEDLKSLPGIQMVL